jgi:D-alanyl-D-alanine carboxypeptidase
MKQPRRRPRLVLFLALACVGVAAVAVFVIARLADSGEPRLERLTHEIVAAGAPGALLLRRDGSRTERAAAGDVGVDDRFRIGSVTKSFVAVVVLQLVAEGRIRLDDNVASLLPRLVPNGRRITVRQLLAHRSGLYDYVDDPAVFSPYATNPSYVWTPRGLVALAVSHPPVFTLPGKRFAYSSTNYLVLQLIVEAATGTSLERSLRLRIFEPLGLHATSFEPFRVRGPYAHGHRSPSHQGVVTGPPADTSRLSASWAWGAGAIVSTPDDLARFFRALLAGKLVPRALLDEMEAFAPASRIRYGLGLAAFPTPCGPAWGHTGNIAGTIAVAWNTRDAGRQVVLMVDVYPLSAKLEAAVRRAQLAAFCS